MHREDVERVEAGPDASGWSPREAVLLRSVDALITGKDLDDAQWSGLCVELTDAQLVEFVLLVTHYDMLATFLSTLRVTPDRTRARGRPPE